MMKKFQLISTAAKGNLDRNLAVVLAFLWLAYLFYILSGKHEATLITILNFTTLGATMVWHTCRALYCKVIKKTQDTELNRNLEVLTQVRNIIDIRDEKSNEPVKQRAESMCQ